MVVLLNIVFIHGMDKVFEIIEGGEYSECYLELEMKKEHMC